MNMRVRDEDLVVRQVGPETVVYDRGRHCAHCLRPLAAAVWRECDGRRSTAEIAERVSAARVELIDETAVQVALHQLERAGLIEERAPRSAEADSGARGAPAGRRNLHTELPGPVHEQRAVLQQLLQREQRQMHGRRPLPA